MIDHEAYHSNPSSLSPLETLADRVRDISKLGSHDALGPASRIPSSVALPYYPVNHVEKPRSRKDAEFRCVGAVHRGIALHTPRRRHCASSQMEERGAETLELTEEQLLLCTPYICGFAFADKEEWIAHLHSTPGRPAR